MFIPFSISGSPFDDGRRYQFDVPMEDGVRTVIHRADVPLSWEVLLRIATDEYTVLERVPTVVGIDTGETNDADPVKVITQG
jgi:biotin synthase-related radical SAM superfamily protein